MLTFWLLLSCAKLQGHGPNQGVGKPVGKVDGKGGQIW